MAITSTSSDGGDGREPNLGQFDYAIEMAIQALEADPENVEAHEQLRQISLRRKAQGGRALGMLERMKLKHNTSDPLASLLGAEKMLAYDPGNMDYMMAVAEAASVGGFQRTARWIIAILRRLDDFPG